MKNFGSGLIIVYKFLPDAIRTDEMEKKAQVEIEEKIEEMIKAYGEEEVLKQVRQINALCREEWNKRKNK